MKLRIKIRRTIRSLIISSCLISGSVHAQNIKSVRLGVGQVNITPDKPTLMSGYGDRRTPFTGIHDSIYASAFYFTGADVENLLITSDLIGFSADFVDDVRGLISASIGIRPQNIMLVAVHNHGGPTIDENGPESVREYTDVLKKKLVLLASKASKSPVPFRMGLERGHCELNVNRRAEFSDNEVWLGKNPNGPCDHELDVIKFEDMENKPLAILINWPCHGTASGDTNYQITGDWPGSATRYIQEHGYENMIVGVTAGASADIDPIYGPGKDFAEINAVGYHVGREATHVLEKIEMYPVKTLQSLDTILVFPGKKRSPGHLPVSSYESGPDTKIRLSALKIGSLVLAGISGELMTEIGLEIKKQSPYSETVVITHCNGSSGYICTDNSYPRGGYEIQVTKLLPGVEKPLITNIVQQIRSFD